MFRALAPKLRAKGWRAIIPLVPGEKRPIMKGWEAYNLNAPSDALIDAWCAAYPGAGIGKAAGPDHTIDVDLDFLDAPIAKAAIDATQSILGKSPLIRQGRKPKSLHIYRLAADADITGKNFGGFELFTKSGQIVLFGVHPDTRRPYQWIGDGGATPLDIGPDELPIATGEQLRELIAALREIAARNPAKPQRAGNGRRTRSPAARVWTGLLLDGAASDRASGVVAAVAPDLRASADPLTRAGALIAASEEGDRHPTMAGAVIALAEIGFSDGDIRRVCLPAYCAKFTGADARARAGDIIRTIKWARERIGPDGEELAAMPWMRSIAAKWGR